MSPSIENDPVSEAKEILTIKQIQDYIDAPITSTDITAKVVEKLQKQIFQLMLDGRVRNKRIVDIEETMVKLHGGGK